MKPNFISNGKPLLKPSARWMILAAVVAGLTASGITLQTVSRFRRSSPATADSVASPSPTSAVSALGYLRPQGEVIDLSAPVMPNGMGSRVAQLFVEEGDVVRAGQVVAVLDNFESLEAAVHQAVEEVKVAQADLAQVQAGAQTGELAAQNATIARLNAERQGQLSAQDQTIARLEAEFRNAQIEYERYRELYEVGAVTASQQDNKHLIMTTAREQLQEAQVNRNRIETTFQEQIKAAEATLEQIAEVRPTDMQAAQARVNRAIAQVAKAQADLNLASIRAPSPGQILKIHTRPGELVSEQGIVALGQTEQMNVIAEVYELDVNRVRVGQRAEITSNVFSDKLYGTVTQVGFQINPQNIVSTDPVADVDQRVVEVKIRLDPADSRQVASFTNLQVNVVIHSEQDQS